MEEHGKRVQAVVRRSAMAKKKAAAKKPAKKKMAKRGCRSCKK